MESIFTFKYFTFFFVNVTLAYVLSTPTTNPLAVKSPRHFTWIW